MMQFATLTITDFIRTWLFAADTKNTTIHELSRALHEFSPSLQSEQQWQQQIQRTLDWLVTQEQVYNTQHDIWDLTAIGYHDVAAWLGVAPTESLSWYVLRTVHLQIRALRLPRPCDTPLYQRITQADGLRAAVLNDAYQLTLDPYPTLYEVRDALLWHGLMRSDVIDALRAQQRDLMRQPFQLAPLTHLIMAKLLGHSGVQSIETALKQLAAKAVSATTTDVHELRSTILRHALAPVAALPTIECITHTKPQDELAVFAATVMAHAHATVTGRFGEDKIFISHVWQALQMHGEDFGCNEITFKQRLAEANNRGLLRLSRADLAHTLNADDVAQSSTQYLTATFHFIRLD
jgi:hypothetical protein